MARKLASWLDAFYEYTDGMPSPKIFRKWAGLSILAGALERKVWLYVNAYKSNLYPNLYVVLCGPPGVGKTVLSSLGQELLHKLPNHHVAPSSVSRASLMDRLREAERHVILPNQIPEKFHSLSIIANELGVFMPAYDNDFMATLTDLYDCKEYGEKKRGKDLAYHLPHPQLNMLAATAPASLIDILPENAWDHGFMSRVVLVYSQQIHKTDLFTDPKANKSMWDDLVWDLKHISELYGKIEFAPEAAAAITEWHNRDGPPRPTHPRLTNYSTRRTAHLLKLCMIAAASTHDELVIDLVDYQTALGWLLEAEFKMEDVFKSITISQDMKFMKDVWHYCVRQHVKNGGQGISFSDLVNFVKQGVQPERIEKFIEIMCKARWLEKKLDVYIPQEIKDF